MGKRVLIVDDAAFMRMMIKDILVKNGYEIAGEAENGQKAVAMYQELRPDVVTMDITMPEMDGIAAVKAIKQIDPQARIIMCSAMGQQLMVMEAIQAGARDFIVKPFQQDRVLQALEKALA
ncbi:response regulator [Neomoorella thermoacetica]|uniref:Stage 0 sporulation protein A homolog n=3 Tax=Neomoorella thermoacetica TaxID=1525 RepID=A0A1D7X954_NEOTH|nr:response regulator [Moorella thermoacetica]AKX93552.1 chemotaxis protein CheY [Moorella thermoacetica]AKX96199.1 chemotaxis protein CheY [Moorella thermoacetica]AOQ23460.1 Chemotaxis protein CheY [Moorella thermoacetica]APC07923.1 chemotaxis protein CheY [Moorella thermoacetica]OIQ09794.1 chemotaxis protein CheY [Moorella thermoacetica]